MSRYTSFRYAPTASGQCKRCLKGKPEHRARDLACPRTVRGPVAPGGEWDLDDPFLRGWEPNPECDA